jgi:hypothetical protein
MLLDARYSAFSLASMSRVLAVGQINRCWLVDGCIGTVVDAITFAVHEQASVPSLLRSSLSCAHETNPLANGRISADYIFRTKNIDVDGPRSIWE